MTNLPQLMSASVSLEGATLTATWTIDGDLLEAPPSLLSVTLTGGENGPIDQFAFRLNGGAVTDRYWFDFVEVHNYYLLDVEPERMPDGWRAEFPLPDHAAREGVWKATLSYEGVAVESHATGDL